MQSNQDLLHVHSPLSSEAAAKDLFAIDDNKDLVTNPGSELTHDIPTILNFDPKHQQDPGFIISAIGKVSTKHSKIKKKKLSCREVQ